MPPASRLISPCAPETLDGRTSRRAPGSTVMPPVSIGRPLALALPMSLEFVSAASPIKNEARLLTRRLLTTRVVFFDAFHTVVLESMPSPICRFPRRSPAEFLSVSVELPCNLTKPSFIFKPELPFAEELLEVVKIPPRRISTHDAFPSDVSFDLPPWPPPEPPEIARFPFTSSWGAPAAPNRSVGPSEVPLPVIVRFLQRASGRSTVTVTPGVLNVTSEESPGTERPDQVLVSPQPPDATASYVTTGVLPLSYALRGRSRQKPAENERMPAASTEDSGMGVPGSVLRPA